MVVLGEAECTENDVRSSSSGVIKGGGCKGFFWGDRGGERAGCDLDSAEADRSVHVPFVMRMRTTIKGRINCSISGYGGEVEALV